MCEVAVCGDGGLCVQLYREVDVYLDDVRSKVDVSPAGGKGGLFYHFWGPGYACQNSSVNELRMSAGDIETGRGITGPTRSEEHIKIRVVRQPSGVGAQSNHVQRKREGARAVPGFLASGSCLRDSSKRGGPKERSDLAVDRKTCYSHSTENHGGRAALPKCRKGNRFSGKGDPCRHPSPQAGLRCPLSLNLSLRSSLA